MPEPAVLLALANQLDNLRVEPPKPKEANSEPWEGDGTKEETPKKVKRGGDRRHSKEASQVPQGEESVEA